MRCRACDKALSDFESTRKSVATGEFLDLCIGCGASVPDMEVAENFNLFDGTIDDLTIALPGNESFRVVMSDTDEIDPTADPDDGK